MRLALTRSLLALGGLAAAVAGCEDSSNCRESGSVLVCGDFGTSTYVTELGASVQWPPVAIADGKLVLARGNELIEINAAGKVKAIAKTDQALTAPSLDTDGSLFVQGGAVQGNGNSTTTVRVFGKDKLGDAAWQKPLQGSPVGTPPSLGLGVVHAATAQGSASTTLYTLDRDSGSVLRERKGASPAAVLADGSLRFLGKPAGMDTQNGALTYSTLVAEDAAGKVLWTYTDSQKILDFAPGAAGETYVVTSGNHVLRRVSAQGVADWSFQPPCENCTVAAAPTIADGVVYFPVWETRNTEMIDPLYALDAKTGAQRWVYDGFFTKKSSYAPFKHLNPGNAGEAPVDSSRVQHHPAGRPVVAGDGTLYVSTDGAVAALDKDGQMMGVAMYDSDVGEVSNGFMAQAATWINPGVRPSPVLGPDGMLYVWDGATVHAFKTGRMASTSAWVAPFGGPDNAGRAPR